MNGWMNGWMGGWVGGWVGVNAVLRFATEIKNGIIPATFEFNLSHINKIILVFLSPQTSKLKNA